ncbi:MAG: hypothetical protein HKO12_06215 [Woeseiaceae bacterium]|nr:hypothetical protein [Woeseiaceae bacterium]
MSKTDSEGPWPIDVEKLRQSAMELEAIVQQLSQGDARVKIWYEGLESVVEKARAGQITETLAELPTHGSSFTYGYLEGLPRLEAAYARFWGILAFGEWEKNKRLEKRLLEMKRKMYGE